MRDEGGVLVVKGAGLILGVYILAIRIIGTQAISLILLRIKDWRVKG